MKFIISFIRQTILLLVLTSSMFILGSNSNAATFTVTNLNDSGDGSLRKAIEDANMDVTPDVVDVIEFDVSLSGSIPTDAVAPDNIYTGQIEITDDLIINGPGSEVITIDAQEVDRIFIIDSADDDIEVTIRGLTLENGFITNDNGAAILNTETLSIYECTFESNESFLPLVLLGEGGGGAIFNMGTINEISDASFIQNGTSSHHVGGAIVNIASLKEINNSTFSGNFGGFMGGAIFDENDQGDITKINNCTFTGNSAIIGGAYFYNGFGSSEITNSTFSGNKAIGNAIGGAIAAAGILSISFTTIANNEAPVAGGIIESRINGGIVNIRNSIVANNAGGNCVSDTADDIADESGDEKNNYSDDDTCGFDFDNAKIRLGPLADNGGSTQTLALLRGANDPVDGASADCDAFEFDDITMTHIPSGIALQDDQTGFARPSPSGGLCDSGAYEFRRGPSGPKGPKGPKGQRGK